MHRMWRGNTSAVANAATTAGPYAPLVAVWVAFVDGVVAWVGGVVDG